MLTFTDEALILQVDKFGDHDAILHVFSGEHGVVRGVAKRALSSKNRADTQPGTLVQVNWKARLAEHLGSITFEARHSFAARVMNDPLALAATGSILSLLSVSVAERDPHPELYAKTIAFLKHVAAQVDPLVWLGEYVRLELALLTEVGFGPDLSACAATGTREDLCYVSPKSSKAVSRAAGEPYHERLLPLPLFLMEPDSPPESMAEVADGLRLTGHFITERLLPALHRHTPPLRSHFSALLGREIKAA